MSTDKYELIVRTNKQVSRQKYGVADSIRTNSCDIDKVNLFQNQGNDIEVYIKEILDKHPDNIYTFHVS